MNRLKILAATLAVTASFTLTLAAATAESAEISLSFEPIKFPMSVEEKRGFVASPNALINGKMHPITFNELLKPGDKLGDVVFGQLVDINGKPMLKTDGSPKICDLPDFMSLTQAHGKLFMINQFECRPAVMYLTELNQDMATGHLAAISTRPIDFSTVNGASRHCAGMVTPWNTHLSSEEDVRNARNLKVDGTLDKEFAQTATYLAGKAASPYMWGWVPEVSILNGAGETKVTKHYALGRMSTEIAYALPDERTVFLSEDNINSPLVMFVADTERDLSAGTLYAAKWTQWGDRSSSGNLEWISLGHATTELIDKFVNAPTTFDQLFDTAKPNEDGSCPTGFKSINAEFNHECLALRPGMEVAASRLETGRYAALVGATTEFLKLEGVTFDPDTKRLYLAVSSIGRGMLDADKKYDAGGPNDLRMAANNCGAVYALDAASGQKDSIGGDIDSDYAFDKMYSLVSGSSRTYKDPAFAANKCDIESIAGPDNLTYLPGSGLLIIAEDTHDHEIDMIWAFDIVADKLTRIQSSPYGSETTAAYWYPNINGWGYLSSVVQDPFGDEDDMPEGMADTVPSAARRSSVGFIGPFPALSN